MTQSLIRSTDSSARVHRGVVLLERAGQTHVLAVAFDLTIITERCDVAETILVRVIGGVVRP